MSKIELNGVSDITCVETNPPIEMLQGRYRPDTGSLQTVVKVAAEQAPTMTCGCALPLDQCTCAAGSARGFAAQQTGAIGTGIAALLTIAMRLLRTRRLRHERRAMAPGVHNEADLLDRLYVATLDRLGDRNASTWWRKVILKAQGDFVLPPGDDNRSGPHFLRLESVREWLSDYQVRADFKVLATQAILACGTDAPAARARLAVSYAHYTLDDPATAKARIEAVVCGLVAGVLIALSHSQQVLVALTRQNNLHRNHANAEILAAISRIESRMAPSARDTLPRSERTSNISIAPSVAPGVAVAKLIELTEAAAA